MSERHDLFSDKTRLSDPFTVFLDVAKIFFIEIDLAKVMQQSTHGDRFVGYFFFPFFAVFIYNIFEKPLIGIHAVLA